MMSPKVAGIEVPPLKLIELNERQLSQLDPFQREVWRRLDDGARQTYALQGAVEGLAKKVDDIHAQNDRRERRSERRANWRAVATSGGVSAIVIAVITMLGNAWTERIKADAANRVDAQTLIERHKQLEGIEARLTSRLEEMGTELERYKRNAPAPIGKEPDMVARAPR